MGTVIITDRCNLQCKHCSVSNILATFYRYAQIRQDLQQLYALGVRIVFFYGGEPCLWHDDGKTLRDLIIEAKQMGFLIVNIVTNGTFPIDFPEADLILVSLDGDRQHHNAIRGKTYDTILKHIEQATNDNICLYMSINQMNKDTIEDVCLTAQRTKNVRAVSFNFHTPYPDTQALMLSRTQKADCCHVISRLIDQGFPILNLRQAFPALIDNDFPTPCHQCIVIENGKQHTCGRCIDTPGLCQQCGYFFVAEYGLLFQGNVKIILEMLTTYCRYI